VPQTQPKWVLVRRRRLSGAEVHDISDTLRDRLVA
jgi:hypothetical protein